MKTTRDVQRQKRAGHSQRRENPHKGSSVRSFFEELGETPTLLPPVKTLRLSDSDRLIIASALLHFVESPLSKGLRKDAKQLAKIFVPNLNRFVAQLRKKGT